MDSITHVVVGACLGEAIAGKKIGNRALVYGVVAHNFPDIDVITSLWMSADENLLAHRGFTHSILFQLIMTVLFTVIARRMHPKEEISTGKLAAIFASGLLLHIILDSLNAYGTGLLEPFSHYRAMWNVLFVADPFFTLWPAIVFLSFFFVKRMLVRKRLAIISLTISALYVGYAAVNKRIIDHVAKDSLIQKDVTYSRYFSTPTPLNSWLWFIVAEDERGYHIGYRSVFDESDEVRYHYLERNAELLDTIGSDPTLNNLIRFSQGYYTVEAQDTSVVFNDLRFGQMNGWANPGAGFVFHYYLKESGDNDLVIQRGRFTLLEDNALQVLIKRIFGE